MTHNKQHGKSGHSSRGPNYETLHEKGEFWSQKRANRRFKRENKLLGVET